MSRNYITEFDMLFNESDRIYHNYASALGISDCALWILNYALEKNGDVRQADICERIFVSRQTVNSSLKKLEKGGYLVLRKIEGKMGKTIHLTPEGKAFAEKYIRPLAEAEQRTVNAFPDEELQYFLTKLRCFVTCLNTEISKEQERLTNAESE